VTQRARGFAHFTFTVKAARGCLTLPQFPRSVSEQVRASQPPRRVDINPSRPAHSLSSFSSVFAGFQPCLVEFMLRDTTLVDLQDLYCFEEFMPRNQLSSPSALVSLVRQRRCMYAAILCSARVYNVVRPSLVPEDLSVANWSIGTQTERCGQPGPPERMPHCHTRSTLRKSDRLRRRKSEHSQGRTSGRETSTADGTPSWMHTAKPKACRERL
jgi:hypothetical protein